MARNEQQDNPDDLDKRTVSATPKEEDWQKQEATIAGERVEVRFTPEEAQEWKKRGYDPPQAAQMKAEGRGPEEGPQDFQKAPIMMSEGSSFLKTSINEVASRVEREAQRSDGGMGM